MASGLFMLQRFIDDIKDSAGTTLKLSSLVLAAAVALLITLAFLCAALFIYTQQEYGTIQACLAVAAIFFVVAVIALVIVIQQQKRAEARRAEALAAAKTASQSLLSDPVLLATGVQIIRSIGIKRLLPVVALGGLALGLMAYRDSVAARSDDKGSGG